MEAAPILEIKPALTTFRPEFDGGFGRRTTRRYLDVYVAGQLADLDRKSVEPLADAAGDFHPLLDGEWFLPEETWPNDRTRCHAAGLPDDVVYRPKWKIALEQVRRALSNSVRCAGWTFDEG